jgi:hypothetical protein
VAEISELIAKRIVLEGLLNDLPLKQKEIEIAI